MNEKIASILFLAFLALIPLAMIAGIVILIVRKVKRRVGFAAVAAKHGWRYLGNDAASIAGLYGILQPALFAMRDGEHTLKNVVQGTHGGIEFWVAHYHYVSKSSQAESRMGGRYSLIGFPRRVQGPDLWLQHRSEGILAAAAESVLGDRMVVPEDPAWSWALVSSAADLPRMSFKTDAAGSLQRATSPGDALFYLGNLVVFSVQGERDAAWAVAAPDTIEAIGRLQD